MSELSMEYIALFFFVFLVFAAQLELLQNKTQHNVSSSNFEMLKYMLKTLFLFYFWNLDKFTSCAKK